MTPRTATLPPTEPAMWRKLLAAVHPDRAGDHETFIWAMNLKDHVCEGKADGDAKPPPRAENSESVPFDPDTDHLTIVRAALARAEEVGDPYASILRLLKGCGVAHFGPKQTQQQRGATYKQLAAIGHTARMSKPQRGRWYRLAEGIPLSRRCAGHILQQLKEDK